MPFELSVSLELFAAGGTEQFFHRLRLAGVVGSSVRRQITGSLESSAAYITFERCFASMNSHVLSQLSRNKESLFTVQACTFFGFKVSLFVLFHQV